MNKFLTNFQRTGAMFPVANNMFSDWWNGGSKEAPANQNAGTQPSDESKQQSQGSSQMAVAIENANDADKPENIWEEKKDDKGNPITPAQQKAMFEDLNIETTNDIASKVNFISEEDSAMIAAIVGDDPEKQKAMSNMLNLMAQRSFAQSTLTTAKGLGQEVSNSLNDDSRVRKAVDEELKMSAMVDQFPMAKDPTTKPIFLTIAKQVMKQYPEADRQKVMDITQKQLDNLIKIGSGGTTTQTEKAETAKDPSWDNFFAEAGR